MVRSIKNVHLALKIAELCNQKNLLKLVFIAYSYSSFCLWGPQMTNLESCYIIQVTNLTRPDEEIRVQKYTTGPNLYMYDFSILGEGRGHWQTFL